MTFDPAHDRRAAMLVVALVWVGVYLPGLGIEEFHGEEATRAQPAQHMLRTGQWVLPHLGGEPYFKKPPLINWLLAGAFAVTGSESEFVARLASALLILVFAAQLILQPCEALGLRARLIAALALMTCLIMIEKGRTVEIEASYLALTGMATYWWLVVWAGKGSRWALWLAPGALLAAGMLEKGPVHLLAFYPTVACLAAAERRWRDVLCLPHLLAVAVVVGLPAIWAWLAAQQAAAPEMTGQWSDQLLTRLTLRWRDVGKWLVSIPAFVGAFLPWAAALPLLFLRRTAEAVPPEHRRLFAGLRAAAVVAPALFMIMPGFRPRYAMPALPVICLALGWAMARWENPPRLDRLWRGALIVGLVLAAAAAVWMLVVGRDVGYAPPRLRVGLAVAGAVAAAFALALRCRRDTLFLAGATAVMMVCAVNVMASYTAPEDYGRGRLRDNAGQIAARVPPAETTYVLRPQTHAFVFYLRPPTENLTRDDRIPPRVEYLIAREHDLERLKEEGGLGGREAKLLYEFPDTIKDGWRLVKLEGG